MKSTMMAVQLSTNQILERAGLYFPRNQIVGRLPDKSLHRRSYGEIYRRARQLAKALREGGGIGRGEAVATLSWNHAWHLECYFGIPAAGAILHTINLRLAPEDIAFIVQDADDRILIIDDVLLPVWEKVRLLLSAPPRVIVVPYSGAPVPEGYENYEDFITVDAADYKYPEQDENEAVGICYTSGTTGNPKGVVYSHRSMILHALAGCMPDLFSISARDRILLVTPMFHCNAWAVPFSALMAGADQIMPGPHMGGEDLLELMETEKTTLAVGVPTIWATLHQTIEKTVRERPLDTAAGMRMLVGGAPVSPALIANFEQHGMHVVQGWGMTEMSPIGSFPIIKSEHAALPKERQFALRGMQGVAAALVQMRIVDDDGTILPWDGESAGEVQVRGPWVTGSYHNMTEPAPDKFTADGWLCTGDVAVIDEDGYMRIVDRSKDVIKSGGEWISSVQLESLALGHPDVLDAAVIAIPHPKWDERPLVLIVKRPEARLDAAALRTFFRPHLARFQIPDDYEFVESIPRNSTGKIMKRALRETFRERASATPS